MKSQVILSTFILIMVYNCSCQHNRLKTNEKELAKEILLQENQKKAEERIDLEKRPPESMNRISGSLRKKEIRSIDPGRLPVHLDIPGTRSNSRKFKLSDVAYSIRYVKLETPPDTSLLYDPFFNRSGLISSVKSDGEHIILQGVFGLTRFNMQGEYQETIWKNETGISFYGGSVFFGGKDFFGVLHHIPVSLSDGNLYYFFKDGPAGNCQVMKYKPGTNKSISVQSTAEIPMRGTIQGDTLLNAKITSLDLFHRIYGTGTDSWTGINNKWNAGRSGSLIVTYNDKGDTLCQFTDYDRIVNFNHANWRHPVELASYYYDGLITIKQEYNDTVFRLIPPDRLLPVYIIDFGEYKVNYKDGLNPDFDLSGKYVLKSLHETNDFLFIRYTQNYDAPVTRKKNSVKFYNAIFDKREGKLYYQPGFTLLPEGLINDLDGGLPFWPEFITPQGEMMKLVSGKMMKDYFNSAGFREAVISREERRKQVFMASGLKETDMIILIVK